MASVLSRTTGIHHSVAELKLRHLDCFFLYSLDCGTCLRINGVVNHLVDELRLEQLDCLLRLLDQRQNGHVYHSIKDCT